MAILFTCISKVNIYVSSNKVDIWPGIVGIYANDSVDSRHTKTPTEYSEVKWEERIVHQLHEDWMHGC